MPAILHSTRFLGGFLAFCVDGSTLHGVRTWRRVLAAVVACCLVTAVDARAQSIPNIDTSTPIAPAPNPRFDGVVRVARVDLGLTGEIALDRQGPITVWITSGTKAWSGVLSVSYTGTAGELVVNHVDAATTPSRVTPVEIIARLPNGVASVDILGNGRRLATLTQLPSGRELPLPVAMSGTAMVGTLGDVSAFRQTRERMGLSVGTAQVQADDPTDALWSNVHVEAIRRVPQAWIAYEQCDAIVATSTALEALGERGRGPLLDWVRSGGHLVVISDSSSREWALAGCGDAIEMDDVSSVGAPEELRKAVVGFREQPAGEYQVRTRPIRVRDSSWQAMWPIEHDPERSLGAQGPMGMGFVTVFGGDPGRWTPVASNESGILIWRRILRSSIEGAADTSQPGNYSGIQARASAASRRWLLSRAFDTPLPNPRLLSVLVMLLVIGLAVILGPMDMLMLRRLKMRHRSHRTALAWLAAASLLAYLTPLAVRSSRDALARGRATDIVQSADGSAIEAVTGVTLVYAGTGTAARLEGMGEGAWCNQGGIDASYYYGGPRVAAQPLDIVQGAGATGVRQGIAAGMDVGQWTFRIVEDIQPARASGAGSVRARVERVGEEWRVTVEGLGEHAQAVEACTLDVLGSTTGVALERDGNSRWTGYANAATTAFGPFPNEYGEYAGHSTDARIYRLQLPLTRRRSRAFESYSDCEGWSVVTMLVHRTGSDVTAVGRAFAAKTIDVVRIAVPTPDARRAEAPDGPMPGASDPGGAAPNMESDPLPSEDRE